MSAEYPMESCTADKKSQVQEKSAVDQNQAISVSASSASFTKIIYLKNKIDMSICSVH